MLRTRPVPRAILVSKACGLQLRAAGSIQVRTFKSKVTTVDEAVKNHLRADQTVLCGGFGISGIPQTFFDKISETPELKNLTCVSNNAGFKGFGLDKLISGGQVGKMIMSYIGGNKDLLKAYRSGKIEIEITPQGTIAERCRAAASGAPAFFTPTGADTWVEEGKLPLKYDDAGNVVKTSEPKETRIFDGRKYLLEKPLHADVALIKCWKADPAGNLVFRGTTLNFNEVMAKAAKITLVEADELVELGDISPEAVHVPGIHVDAVVKSTAPKQVEVLMTEEEFEKMASKTGPARLQIAKRVAKEFRNGDIVNLGIGLPTLAPNFIEPGVHVEFQSENGILGMGPYPTQDQVDPDITNAGKETVTLLPGAATFGSEDSFCMIRAGKINTTVLGAIEVSQYGDLANWGVAGDVKGMGGAMDLVSARGKTKVVVCTTHNAKDGSPKIVETCTNPLTGAGVVSVIVTEKAVFEVDPKKGLTLIELQPGATLEDVRETTGAPFEEDLRS